MSEPNANPFDLLFEKIRQIVREEIAMAIPNEAGCATEKDALLTAQQAAALMGARLAGCIATIKTFRSHAVSIENSSFPREWSKSLASCKEAGFPALTIMLPPHKGPSILIIEG